jgi:hypothetical protein
MTTTTDKMGAAITATGTDLFQKKKGEKHAIIEWS